MPATTETESYKPERATSRTISNRGALSAGGPRPYPVKLLELYETPGDYGPQLYLEMERQDEVWDDTGEKSVTRHWFSLTGSDGEPIWEGSDTDQAAASFEEVTGTDFFSDEAESLVGTFFMMVDINTGRKNKKDKDIYFPSFIENLGTEYTYGGKVRRRPSQNSNVNGASATEPLSDNDVAEYLAAIFDGQAVSDLKNGAALNLVKDDPQLADVKTIFGKTLRGGLVRPQSVLIGLLIENGYGKDIEGTFTRQVPEDDIPFE